MIDLNELKEFLQTKLTPNEFVITEVNFNFDDGETILHCEVAKKNPKDKIDLEVIEVATQIISDALDEIEEKMPDSYMLNVESSGAEREVTLDELNDLVGEYFEIHLNEPIKEDDVLIGTLLESNNEMIKLQYFIKGRKKIQEITKKNIKMAKLVVKI